jgi:hypothetical protein
MSVDSALIDGVEQLLADYRGIVADEGVLAAVARSQVQVRDRLGVLGVEMPAPDEYASVVVGLARQELAVRREALTTVAPRRRR